MPYSAGWDSASCGASSPRSPPNRYERKYPGELLHIDVKKLARIKRPGHWVHGDRSRRNPGAGWEFVHVCVDDATRVAYVEVLEDEKAVTAVGFLRRALSFYRSLGVEVERVLTDNGGAYISLAHAVACRLSLALGTSGSDPIVPEKTARRSGSSC